MWQWRIDMDATTDVSVVASWGLCPRHGLLCALTSTLFCVICIEHSMQYSMCAERLLHEGTVATERAVL